MSGISFECSYIATNSNPRRTQRQSTYRTVYTCQCQSGVVASGADLYSFPVYASRDITQLPSSAPRDSVSTEVGCLTTAQDVVLGVHWEMRAARVENCTQGMRHREVTRSHMLNGGSGGPVYYTHPPSPHSKHRPLFLPCSLIRNLGKQQSS